jgi:hypothetical protein
MIDIGPQVKSDESFVAQCRLHQSKYRATILKEECGYGPTVNSKTPYGNYLLNGENTGNNFISETAFQYAKQRVRDKVICPELTIDTYRLFNNMLSSMPLCFNLFSDLRDLLLNNPTECSTVVKALFKELTWIVSVEYVGVEFIPIPTEDYIDDKSAFDAIFIVKDSFGKHGIISIETKYTDLLGKNTSSKNDRKNLIIQEDSLFSDEITHQLLREGYRQIYRNFLLTYTYAKRNRMANFANVIISPKEDILSIQEYEELSNGLRNLKKVIFKTNLDEFLERGICSGVKRIADVFTRTKERYIPE